MTDAPTNETALVRISTEAHAMLREMANIQRRTLGGQAEVLIEMAWNNMKSNPPVARPNYANRPPQPSPSAARPPHKKGVLP